jgi:hypothetical protein
MEIIFQGKHDSAEAIESLEGVIKLFKERYNISQFREMHLSITLVNEKGDDVELVDTDTNHAFRTFEVYREGLQYTRTKAPALKLVIDNTRSK